MTDVSDALPIEKFIRGLLRPLATAADTPAHATQLLLDLGYLPPATAPALGELVPILTSLEEGFVKLYSALEAEDEGAITLAIVQLVKDLGRFFTVLPTVIESIEAAFTGSSFLTDTNLAAELPRRLVDYMIVRFLEDEHPTLQAVLVFLGVITNEDVLDAATPSHVPHRSRVVHWERFQTAFKDPRAALDTVLWDGNSLRYLPLLSMLQQIAVSFGLPAGYASPQHPLLTTLNNGVDLSTRNEYDSLLTLDLPLYRDPVAAVGLEIYPIVNVTTGDVEGIGVGVGLGLTLEIPLSDAYRMALKAHAEAADAFGIRVRRGEPVKFVSSLLSGNPAAIADSIQFGASVAVEPTEEAPKQPLLQVGAGGSRFEIGSGALRLGVERSGRARFFIEGELRRGRVVIGAGGADGFLATILPAGGIQGNFELGIGFSTDAGLYFTGSSGLEIQLPAHIALGPIEIVGLTMAVKFSAQGIPAELGASVKASLGPLQAVVENMGLRAVTTFPAGGGNLGPLDLTFGFKPPSGVGLSIDVGPVKGGGYLYFDFDNEEYAGALELMFSDIVNLKVIGLITTKMPDGSHGFSLLLIITAEFGAGLQLGYGFKLIGVGGLLGLNRKMLIQPLTEGVRTGAVNNILFPKDVVANAPRIISDLRTIFPPEPNRFLIGPMAKIGWGTPTLITLSLGIIIEIPGNIAIVGVLGLILPDLKSPIVVIQVAFVGAIEFDKKRIYFFAAMFDSRVLFITMSGEMGVLVAFGDNPDFVLAVGGFHPKFNPPPLPFPTPKRISLSILNESWGRIIAETYFAVTTNTVQFGASAELYFGFAVFSVEGSIIFDALMRFSPFYFIIELKITLSLKVFGAGLFGIDLEFALEGTTPWRARGQGTIRILFWDVHKDFDETWGEQADTVLLPVDVMGLLQTELKKIENWGATLAPGNSLLVSLRKLPDQPGVLVLHPLGSLHISQRSVPLDITIDKVGNQRPSDARRFRIRETTGNFTKKADVSEQFAPAQFHDMSDPEKLSRPSFEPLNGGLELSAQGAELRSSRLVKRIVRYEQVVVDTNYKRLVSHLVVFVATLFEHLLNGNAATLSPLSDRYKTQVKPYPDAIQMKPDLYAVAFARDNRAVDQAAAGFSSYADAREFLNRQVADDPNVEATMHVIPAHELNAA